jgi:hypothetical protein
VTFSFRWRPDLFPAPGLSISRHYFDSEDILLTTTKKDEERDEMKDRVGYLH